MRLGVFAKWMLEQEARALLTRLGRVKPFALVEPVLPAAAPLPPAQTAVERFLIRGRNELELRIHAYLNWLKSRAGAKADPAVAQRRFAFLRLRFNAILTHFDLFSDVITQRSESETGIWLAGLDIVSADALALPGYYESPPVLCYLDRGIGAAIRRARTRLPGGGTNPVAIIRVPRERMVGSGVASSLIHEVGHQAAALLDLVNSLRPILQGLQRGAGRRRIAWKLWDRWISEIVADFWSVARIGIASTMGLMGVVSLPRAFVFRMNVDDPHPIPWLRVKLSCAMGNALFPHPQWQRLSAVWESYYPRTGLARDVQMLLALLEETMPAFVVVLMNHRPRLLRGRSLGEVMGAVPRQPAQLALAYKRWLAVPADMYRAPPSFVFAVVGQARADGKMSPELESHVLAKLLTYWALQSTLNMASACAAPPAMRRLAA